MMELPMVTSPTYHGICRYSHLLFCEYHQKAGRKKIEVVEQPSKRTSAGNCKPKSESVKHLSRIRTEPDLDKKMVIAELVVSSLLEQSGCDQYRPDFPVINPIETIGKILASLQTPSTPLPAALVLEQAEEFVWVSNRPVDTAFDCGNSVRQASKIVDTIGKEVGAGRNIYRPAANLEDYIEKLLFSKKYRGIIQDVRCILVPPEFAQIDYRVQDVDQDSIVNVLTVIDWNSQALGRVIFSIISSVFTRESFPNLVYRRHSELVGSNFNQTINTLITSSRLAYTGVYLQGILDMNKGK